MANAPHKNNPRDPKPKRTANYVFFSVLLLCLLAIGGVAVSTFSDTLQNAVIVEDGQTATPQTTTTITPVAVVPATTLTTTTTVATSSVPTTAAPTTPPSAPMYIRPIEGNLLTPFSHTPIHNATLNDHRIHAAIDWQNEEGAIVSAFADGEVIDIGRDILLGEYIVIDHGNGLTSRSGGVKSAVAIGDTVKGGDAIGRLTAVPFEAHLPMHLHFEVYRDGEAIDPTPLWDAPSK